MNRKKLISIAVLVTVIFAVSQLVYWKGNGRALIWLNGEKFFLDQLMLFGAEKLFQPWPAAHVSD